MTGLWATNVAHNMNPAQYEESELRSCVKEEVDALGSLSLIVYGLRGRKVTLNVSRRRSSKKDRCTWHIENPNPSPPINMEQVICTTYKLVVSCTVVEQKHTSHKNLGPECSLICTDLTTAPKSSQRLRVRERQDPWIDETCKITTTQLIVLGKKYSLQIKF